MFGTLPFVLQAYILAAGDKEVTALEASADGRVLAAGDSSGQIRLWRLPEVEAAVNFRSAFSLAAL